MKSFESAFDLLDITEVEKVDLAARNTLMNTLKDYVTDNKLTRNEVAHAFNVDSATTVYLTMGMVSELPLEQLNIMLDNAVNYFEY
tara:strand:+ start:960 stop:1217 length:258 start_codon:yes stop_codon:yes gene_type:complete